MTANFAKEQNRKVFALPHEIGDLHGVGTNNLLKNGATLVTCTDDILEELKLSDFQKNYQSLDKNKKISLIISILLLILILFL